MDASLRWHDILKSLFLNTQTTCRGKPYISGPNHKGKDHCGQFWAIGAYTAFVAALLRHHTRHIHHNDLPCVPPWALPRHSLDLSSITAHPRAYIEDLAAKNRAIVVRALLHRIHCGIEPDE